jgi:hypothetical protein
VSFCLVDASFLTIWHTGGGGKADQDATEIRHRVDARVSLLSQSAPNQVQRCLIPPFPLLRSMVPWPAIPPAYRIRFGGDGCKRPAKGIEARAAKLFEIVVAGACNHRD